MNSSETYGGEALVGTQPAIETFTTLTTTFENPSPIRSRRPRRSQDEVVQRASAFFRDHVAEGVRIAHLSRVVGVSERALRNAFRREHGVSPKQFDVRRRLDDARRALCDVDAPNTVTTIATQYGFFDLGRFAQIYKNAFGESPSQTMRAHCAMTRAAS
jgi:AraC-like DNA-binding protein